MGPAGLWKNLYFLKSNKATEEIPNARSKLAHWLDHSVAKRGPGPFRDVLCNRKQTPFCLCAFFLASSDKYEHNIK